MEKQLKTLRVEMSVDDLSRFVYTENVNNKPIHLDLHGIEDVKDLFCFCIDLLCKGLVYKCMKPNIASIDLDSVTQDEFATVSYKLSRTGIMINLVVKPNQGLRPGVSLGENFGQRNPSMRLEDHTFTIVTVLNQYIVKFSLVPVQV